MLLDALKCIPDNKSHCYHYTYVHRNHGQLGRCCFYWLRYPWLYITGYTSITPQEICLYVSGFLPPFSCLSSCNTEKVERHLKKDIVRSNVTLDITSLVSALDKLIGIMCLQGQWPHKRANFYSSYYGYIPTVYMLSCHMQSEKAYHNAVRFEQCCLPLCSGSLDWLVSSTYMYVHICM